MTIPKHSPLPWSHVSANNYLRNAEGKAIADFRYKNGNVDLPFVCRAVNNHDDLLDALKALIGFADCVLAEPERFGGMEAARNLRVPAFDDARAAIAKAEGR